MDFGKSKSDDESVRSRKRTRSSSSSSSSSSGKTPEKPRSLKMVSGRKRKKFTKKAKSSSAPSSPTHPKATAARPKLDLDKLVRNPNVNVPSGDSDNEDSDAIHPPAKKLRTTSNLIGSGGDTPGTDSIAIVAGPSGLAGSASGGSDSGSVVASSAANPNIMELLSTSLTSSLKLRRSGRSKSAGTGAKKIRRPGFQTDSRVKRLKKQRKLNIARLSNSIKLLSRGKVGTAFTTRQEYRERKEREKEEQEEDEEETTTETTEETTEGTTEENTEEDSETPEKDSGNEIK